MRFQNKVVLITGGSAGIGAATALLIAKEGGSVIIVGRNEKKLKEIEKISEQDGNKVFAIKADVSSEDDAKRIIKETIEKHGKLDVLINNAGILRRANILDGTMFDSFDEVMNTNFRAAVYLTMLAAPHLVKTKGNIVNISSVSGKRPAAGFSVYCASKAALEQFSRNIALELGVHGVRVNLMSPGPVDTGIFEAAAVNTTMEEMSAKTVLNRVSSSEEIAKVIAFVASDDAVGVTGSDFLMDNGYIIKE